MIRKTCILLLLLPLISGLLSACANSDRKCLTVKFDPAKSTVASVHKNKNLQIHVVDKLPGLSGIGGDVGYYNVKFQRLIPWLRSRLASLQDLSCSLDHRISLNISVAKFYNSMESELSVGAIALVGRYRQQGRQRIITIRYRDDCEVGFFSSVKSCFSSALDKIIIKIKQDICRIGMRSTLARPR